MVKKTILCLTHEDFSTYDIIESWAKSHHYHFHVCKVYEQQQDCKQNYFYPDPANVDLLITMGGPQRGIDYENYSYLKNEVDYIKEAKELGVSLFGICLGAQLIGEAFGAKTKVSPEKEIGVFDVRLTSQGEKDPLFSQLPHKFQAIHLHNHMPGMSESSCVLMESLGCPVQAVRYAPNAYGVQFHPEITWKKMSKIVQGFQKKTLPSGTFVETNKEVYEMHDYETMNRILIQILNYLINLSKNN